MSLRTRWTAALAVVLALLLTGLRRETGRFSPAIRLRRHPRA